MLQRPETRGVEALDAGENQQKKPPEQQQL
jgi:hypothetical protein